MAAKKFKQICEKGRCILAGVGSKLLLGVVSIDCKMKLFLLKEKLNKMVAERGIDAPEVLVFSRVVDKAILEYNKNIFQQKCREEV